VNYCSNCGAPVSILVPPDDNRPRHVCGTCGTIHYQNPRIVTGTVPLWQDRVLLCRRAIAPRNGFWTLPAGFLELGETTAGGALRETLEEAQARVELQDLYTLLHVPHVDQVHLMYRAALQDLDFSPGTESSDVRLFALGEIPWDELAFQSVRQTLRFLVDDRPTQRYPLRVGDILRESDGYRFRPIPET
jgi:ADP-ribose pyrophosphatase YjhB (NUDIX family)